MFIVGTLLSQTKNTRLFIKIVREYISDYGVVVSVVIFTVIPYLPKLDNAQIPRLQVPGHFSTTSGRAWFPNFNATPAWAVIFAIVPALILTILFYFDHNVSSLLSQKKEFNLQKPSSYNWDFFALGLTIILTGFLGIPPVNGLIPQAPLHTRSLAIITEEKITML